ncbi:acyl-CoA thioesterase II [Verticiella sediminum]|uniref:Acyl-CoA thioesterase 2 n=1 Tax=Verticiella sediminum TaxID=1247510 RepID=A0A556AB83_9BURK|nr:acyl-CoA thioesterase II [Verticiella sediminum]TSH90127.1 acyl-CoA thioesterase II [Verticiella sediminum]
MSTAEELIGLLQVEQLELNLYRGVSGDIGSRNVFGGQVLGQSLMAATRTVDPARRVHSLHAYFLRAGDKRAPIVYDVDRIRDGKSFTTRRVVAIQHGRPIFHMSASFQVEEDGASHQDPMPEVPAPEGLPTEVEHRARHLPRLPEHLRAGYERDRPIEIRPITLVDPLEPGAMPPVFDAWVRALAPVPDVPGLHQAMLAYTSDFHLLSAALLPHDMSFFDPKLHIASLDHAMWFHRDFRMDDWLLYVTESPSASGSRGISRGKFYTRDGRLVASTVQEGLIRRAP